MKILVVGASGSIGRLVVEEAISKGHKVRALVRSESKAGQLSRDAEVVIGDLTRPETLSAAVNDIDAIIFTHGSDGGGKATSEAVDYRGVPNVLSALGLRRVRNCIDDLPRCNEPRQLLQSIHGGARLEAAFRAPRAR